MKLNAHPTRRGMRLGGLVLVVALVLASCERRNVVAPQGEREPGGLAAAVVPGAGGVAGCARFEVSEGAHGPVSVEPVDTTATAACGSLRIRIEAPVVSGGGRTSLQVHVTNGGSAAVGAPLLVLAWEDSLSVEDPPGLAKNKHLDARVAMVSRFGNARPAGATGSSGPRHRTPRTRCPPHSLLVADLKSDTVRL